MHGRRNEDVLGFNIFSLNIHIGTVLDLNKGEMKFTIMLNGLKAIIIMHLSVFQRVWK